MGRLKDRARPYVVVMRRLRSGQVSVMDLAYARMSFSQFGEDVFLERYFSQQATGFYVDVGAYDPFKGSNTLLLYVEVGGESTSTGSAAFRRLRTHRPHDINLQMAVSIDSVARLSCSPAASRVSTILIISRPGNDAERITVQTQPLRASSTSTCLMAIRSICSASIVRATISRCSVQ